MCCWKLRQAFFQLQEVIKNDGKIVWVTLKVICYLSSASKVKITLLAEDLNLIL